MENTVDQNLNTRINATLSGSDSGLLGSNAEMGWFELGRKQFTGKLGWVTWLLMAVQTTLFAIALWCAINFFAASEVLAAVKWGISFAVLTLSALQIKLSLMPQMQADRVIVEVKKLQLMIAEQQK